MQRSRKNIVRLLAFAIMLLLMGVGLASACGNAAEIRNIPEAGAERHTLAEQELDGKLHAGAAVLMDMDSGRILYEKNGNAVLPMASTTKIMTCIVALEKGNQEDIVTVSAYGEAQPKVHLGMQKGATYKLKDLLYSLMLESHNDSAVVIAEHIGAKKLQNLPAAQERTKEQSREAVKEFCDMMTKKARELGCEETCFLTPNGLDAEAENTKGEQIKHATTAAELAKIMSYCIQDSPKRADFLEITRTSTYSFTDMGGKRNHSCTNHNALLSMLDGVLSGKTGFTSQAGYCYVGALEREGRRFALTLLACGWPGHKTWKWQDCRTLFAYGIENYKYKEFAPNIHLDSVVVLNGAPKDGNPWTSVVITPRKESGDIHLKFLVQEGEEVKAYTEIKEQIQAPVEAGEKVGKVLYYLEGTGGRKWKIGEETVYIEEDIKEKNYCFMLRYIGKNYLL